jgi:hypothetical protein
MSVVRFEREQWSVLLVPQGTALRPEIAHCSYTEAMAHRDRNRRTDMNTNSNIEQLTDAELDLVNGGSFVGQVATTTAATLAVIVPAICCPFILPAVVTGAWVGAAVLYV